MTYNIIDSVKGGCGKTSFALMLANALYERSESEPVFLFDMDLQGTSLAYLLFGKTEQKDVSDAMDYWRKTAEIDMFLNERVAQREAGGKRYIAKVRWAQSKTEATDGEDGATGAEVNSQAEFYAAMGSPIQKHKDKYKPKSNQNYSQEVTYGIFRHGLSNLLKSTQLEKEWNVKPEHIIFDMPPNSDGYSDAALECLLNEKRGVVQAKEICNYFVMLTFNQAHIKVTLDWFESFMTQDQNRNQNNLAHIFFVFSGALSGREDDNSKKHFVECTKQIREDINRRQNLSEKVCDKICFLLLRYSKDYYDQCCAGDGIINHVIKDFSTPVMQIENFSGDFREGSDPEKLTDGGTPTKVCLKVMDGKTLKEAIEAVRQEEADQREQDERRKEEALSRIKGISD